MEREGALAKTNVPSPSCARGIHTWHTLDPNGTVKSLWQEDRAQQPPARVPDVDYSSIRLRSTRMFSLTEAEVSCPYIPGSLI